VILHLAYDVFWSYVEEEFTNTAVWAVLDLVLVIILRIIIYVTAVKIRDLMREKRDLLNR